MKKTMLFITVFMLSLSFSQLTFSKKSKLILKKYKISKKLNSIKHIKKAGKKAIGKIVQLKLKRQSVILIRGWAKLQSKTKKNIIVRIKSKKLRKKFSKILMNKFYNFTIKITSVSKREVKGMILTCGD